jgi:hypothetical protein
VKSRDVLTVNVNLDWRILAILGAIGVVLAFTYSVAVAQGGDPPNINEVQVEPPVDVAETQPVTVPERPEGQPNDYVYTVNGEWVSPDGVGSAPSSVGASDISAQSGSGSSFYVTSANHPTDQALTACASGYHMASLWEILDVSNMVYAYNHPDAHVQNDSGQGPPSGWYGWVRTGWNASTSATAGTGNCEAWTSRSSDDSTVAIQLATAWETAPGDIGPWDATSLTCDHVGPVWCIED